MRRAAQLARISEEPGRLTRPSSTPAMARANARVADWMSDAGMDVYSDAAGSLIGRWPGRDPDAGTLLLGSHLDTVRDAGAYDGALGVLVAVSCVERIIAAGHPLPFAVEVLALADEEGLRFHSAYLGSHAMTGTFAPELLERTDDDGVTLATALRAFEADPDAIADASRVGERLLGFVEVHIEQGPILEERDLALGVVDAIAGATRAIVTFSGAAGHAGTVPMAGRRDAMVGAADWILAVERVGRAHPGLVATVGLVRATPGAPNVIAGAVEVALDLRHADDAVRGTAREELLAAANAIADARDLGIDWENRLDNAAVAMDGELTAALTVAASYAVGGADVPVLTSGAGHDAAVMAAITPAAMLFVRCLGGISHSPEESVREDDVALALAALEALVLSLATEE